MSTDIPKQIIDLINKAAGKEHTKDGQVLTALGQILQLAETLKVKESFTTFLDSRREDSKPVTERPGWDEYFLNIAKAVSMRGDCKRRQIGVVIVRNNRIVSTGYNGTEPGGKSCLAGDCPRANKSDVMHGYADYSDCISIHAEANAIAYANRSDTTDATIYIATVVGPTEPCDMCSKLIKAAGITRVVHDLNHGHGDF